MPPKASTKTAASKPKAPAAHPSYQDMIKEAVISLKERNGSSRQAVKKYVLANNNLGGVTDNAFTTQFNRALQKGSESGVFARPKGTSGPVKLAAPKTTTTKPAAKSTTTKAPAAKKTATKAAATKKAPAKKTAPKKATTTPKKAPAAKKTASKTKANTSKARKIPTAAPAVEEEKAPVVLGKTKSGRVTKSKAPQPATKKVAPKKATPKKSATPKKA